MAGVVVEEGAVLILETAADTEQYRDAALPRPPFADAWAGARRRGARGARVSCAPRGG